MYLEELFNKYAEWRILKYFLENPDQELHVKALARKLRISAGTASNALKKAGRAGLLKKKVIANIHLYSLNKKSSQAKALMKVVDQI